MRRIRLGRYRKTETEEKMSTVGYLLHLDKKLGLPNGSMLQLCQKCVKIGSVENHDYKITYRGTTKRSTKTGSQFRSISRRIFLIEGMLDASGRKVLAQISLPEEATN